MSEPWMEPERMFCACGCGREVVDDTHARVEDILHDGIPALMMYATAECAAQHPEPGETTP